MFLLKILLNFDLGGKCLAISLRKVPPMFVWMFWLYGGLNHIILRCKLFLLLGRGVPPDVVS